MPRPPRIGICVYCGTRGVVTSDHVPPKCLFPPVTRVNLITVDACSVCHDEFKLDDEYFRVTLAIRDDLPDGPEAQFLREQTKKTLRNPAAYGFGAAIRAATSKVERHSAGGIYLGKVTALKVDAVRVTRTAERIVRGLYGKFFRSPLPATYDVTVSLIDLQRDDTALRSPEVEDLFNILKEHGKHQSFGKVFDVWYVKTVDDPDSSFWLVRVHRAFGFFGYTMPSDT